MTGIAETHVNLMGNVTFTPRQLANRWDAELERLFGRSVQDNLRDFRQIKDEVDPETFPNYQANLDLLNAFISTKTTCYIRRVQDEAKNDLLIQVIAYEKAQERLPDLQRILDGQEEIVGVEEVLDPQTGVVVVEKVWPQPAIPPLSPVIMITDVNGNQVEADNPDYLKVVAEISQLEDLIANASQPVLDTVAARASQQG